MYLRVICCSVDRGIIQDVSGRSRHESAIKFSKVSKRVASLRTSTLDIQGHTRAVWAIISLGNATENASIILTGAADNQIIAWHNQSAVRTYEGNARFFEVTQGHVRIADAFLFCPRSLGHSNCVRALVALTTKEFLSCSNDCTIKRWTLDSSQCIQTFQGHTSFVYSISMISPDLFVSVSEDRSARVWSIDTDESVQTIRLPSPTLWSVCSLTNGDVAIACRFASSECIEQWLTESILVMAASAYSRKRNHAWQR